VDRRCAVPCECAAPGSHPRPPSQTRKLDNLERRLFDLGFKSDQQFQDWLRRNAHILRVAPGADRRENPAKRAKVQ
jgi:hypothetical protein